MIAGFRAVALLAGMGGLLTTSMSTFAVVYGQSVFKVRGFVGLGRPMSIYHASLISEGLLSTMVYFPPKMPPRALGPDVKTYFIGHPQRGT